MSSVSCTEWWHRVPRRLQQLLLLLVNGTVLLHTIYEHRSEQMKHTKTVKTTAYFQRRPKPDNRKVQRRRSTDVNKDTNDSRGRIYFAPLMSARRLNCHVSHDNSRLVADGDRADFLFQSESGQLWRRKRSARARSPSTAIRRDKPAPVVTDSSSPGVPYVILSFHGNCSGGSPRINATEYVRRYTNAVISPHDVSVAAEQEIRLRSDAVIGRIGVTTTCSTSHCCRWSTKVVIQSSLQQLWTITIRARIHART